MTKIILLISIIFIIIIIALLVYLNSSNKKYDYVLDKIQNVELGMSKEDVTDIMGKPERTIESLRDSIPIETWFYYADPVASEIPQITFDRMNDKVIGVIGTETYYIYDDNYYYFK